MPIPFAEAVTSGLSVGVPGTPRTWEPGAATVGHAVAGAGAASRPTSVAARRLRRRPDLPRPDRGQRGAVRATSCRPASCSCPAASRRRSARSFRNPDLAAHLRAARRARCRLAVRRAARPRRSCATVQAAAGRPTAATRIVRPGLMTRADLAATTRRARSPTSVGYRGLDVYGMAPPSSGGSTVGEALNILEQFDLRGACDRTQALHHYLEASALAFADRNALRRRSRRTCDVPLDRAAVARVRRRAVLPDRPASGGDQAGAAGQPRRRLRHRLRRPRPTPRRPAPTTRACRRRT